MGSCYMVNHSVSTCAIACFPGSQSYGLKPRQCQYVVSLGQDILFGIVYLPRCKCVAVKVIHLVPNGALFSSECPK